MGYGLGINYEGSCQVARPLTVRHALTKSWTHSGTGLLDSEAPLYEAKDYDSQTGVSEKEHTGRFWASHPCDGAGDWHKSV